MRTKILFTSVKKTHKNFDRSNIERENYYDIECLKDILEKQASPDDLCRIIVVKDYPSPTYRLTIFHNYKEYHTTVRKNGCTATLKPGLYIFKTWYVTKVSPLEFVWQPNLEEK